MKIDFVKLIKSLEGPRIHTKQWPSKTSARKLLHSGGVKVKELGYNWKQVKTDYAEIKEYSWIEIAKSRFFWTEGNELWWLYKSQEFSQWDSIYPKECYE